MIWKKFLRLFKQKTTPKLYLIGALKNRNIIELANRIRQLGYDVFDEWISPGEEADEKWQEYESRRGRTYKEALNGRHAKYIFAFDKEHLDSADVAVLVMPCGRSGHLELGYHLRSGRPGFVLFDEEPSRYDLMYLFCDDVFLDEDALLQRLKGLKL